MKPSARSLPKSGGELLARWRTAWGKRVDEWPTDSPCPDSPGVGTRLQMAADIDAMLNAARAEGAKAALERVNAAAEADILSGNPITGAHHRAIERELAALSPEEIARGDHDRS